MKKTLCNLTEYNKKTKHDDSHELKYTSKSLDASLKCFEQINKNRQDRIQAYK